MIKINLLPTELRAKKKVPFFDRYLLYMLVIVVGWVLILWFQSLQQKAEINRLTAEITRVEGEIRHYNQLKKIVDEIQSLKSKIEERINAIQIIDSQRATWIKVFEDYGSLLPDYVWTEEFIEIEGLVTIKGRSYNLKSIASFIVGLIKSDFFDQIRLNFIKEQTTEKAEVPQFSFELSGKVGPKEGTGISGHFVVTKPEEEEKKGRAEGGLQAKGRDLLGLDRDKAKQAVQGLGK